MKVTGLYLKMGVLLVFVIMVLRMMQLVIVEGSEAAVLASYVGRDFVAGDSQRGLFYDRNGQQLVSNSSYYQLWIRTTDSGWLGHPENTEITKRIAQVLGSELDLDSLSFIPNVGFRIPGVISNQQRLQIQSAVGSRDDVVFSALELREYAYPQALANVLGYTAPVSAEEVAADEYDINDWIGRNGLEAAYEDQLRGLSVDRVVDIGDGLIEGVDLPGYDVELTIDAVWQQVLYELLATNATQNQAREAAAVIMDVNDGAVVASASFPTYDANQMSRGVSPQQLRELLEDSRRPLIDKVTGAVAAPGSTLKPFVALSLLDRRILTRYTTLYSAGCMQLGSEAQFCEIDQKWLGSLNVEAAIYRSSNVFFCKAGQTVEQLGSLEDLISDITRFGFGHSLDIEGSAVSQGSFSTPRYKGDNFGAAWFTGDTCNMMIGQGYTTVSPIQLAGAFSALINGGSYWQPYLVRNVVDDLGEVVESQTGDELYRIDMSDQSRELVLGAMRNTVKSSYGSAYWALNQFDDEWNLRAKTGSTEASELVDGETVDGVHGWVVVNFTYQNRQYVLVVLQRFGGRSSQVLPVARDFLTCLDNDFQQCGVDVRNN